MKGFKKGVSGNPKGKPQGAQNKITQTAREIFLSTLEFQVPNLELAFAEVLKNDKAKYLELFAKYAQFFIPKKTDIAIQPLLSIPDLSNLTFEQLEKLANGGK